MGLRVEARVNFTDCYFCEEPLGEEKGEPVLGVFDRLDGFAHTVCYEVESERAQERMLEDYYGGSAPQTDREQYAVAAEAKRRLG